MDFGTYATFGSRATKLSIFPKISYMFDILSTCNEPSQFCFPNIYHCQTFVLNRQDNCQSQEYLMWPLKRAMCLEEHIITIIPQKR